MGDLNQHSSIYLFNAIRLHKKRVKANYDYLYIGNFLTDLSQFVDPFSSMSAKKTVRKKAFAQKDISPHDSYDLRATLTRNYVIKWTNALLGDKKDTNKRVGSFSIFFKHIALAFAHFYFANDIPKKKKDLMIPGNSYINQKDIEFINFLEPDEVKKIFDKYFTQYYPHEHLDLPPYEIKAADRKNNSYYDLKNPTRLIGYLNTYKKYLIEELFKLEGDWKKKANLPESDFEIKEFHIRFDKILHGIEDYFYHSNFSELYHLMSLLSNKQGKIDLPVTDINDYLIGEFSNDMLAHFKSSKAKESKSVAMEENKGLLKRKAIRRLRYPAYDWAGRESKEKSGWATEFIYTGGFAENDMFHTIIGALESMEEKITHIMASPAVQFKYEKSEKGIEFAKLILFNALFDRKFRNKLDDSKFLEESQTKHLEQLNNGSYTAEIEKLFQNGYINEQGRDSLKAAIELDKSFTKEFSDALGIGQFLLSILSTAQSVYNKSLATQEKLNAGDKNNIGSNEIIKTDNEVSSELIGTHTLMSKDSVHGQPFFREAQALAKFASYLISYVFLTNVTNNKTNIATLNYDLLINKLLRFPVMQGWESRVLKFLYLNGKDPDFEDIHYNPNDIITAIKMDPTQIKAANDFKTKEELEKKYTELEAKTE